MAQVKRELYRLKTGTHTWFEGGTLKTYKAGDQILLSAHQASSRAFRDRLELVSTEAKAAPAEEGLEVDEVEGEETGEEDETADQNDADGGEDEDENQDEEIPDLSVISFKDAVAAIERLTTVKAVDEAIKAEKSGPNARNRSTVIDAAIRHKTTLQKG